MAESKDGRANIDRFTGHMLKHNPGMTPEKAREKAVQLQIRKDYRDSKKK